MVLLYSFLIYDKEKWDGYLQMFKSETDKQRKRGTFLVNLFIGGSIFLFFICLIAGIFFGK